MIRYTNTGLYRSGEAGNNLLGQIVKPSVEIKFNQEHIWRSEKNEMEDIYKTEKSLGKLELISHSQNLTD